MPAWIIITTLGSLALVLALGLYLLARQRQRQRLELRLLPGRRQLWEQELASYLQEFAALDQKGIAALRQEAESSLDQLQITLVERQAHLLNCEDMTHLQQCKIDLLAATSTSQPQTAIPELVPEPDPPIARPKPARETRRVDTRDRSQIESNLLDRISQLQDRKKPKK